MIRDMEAMEAGGKAVAPRKLFEVTKPLYLNETASPMRSGQTGFAYVPPGDPVELEIDNLGYTVSRRIFEAAIKWREPA